MSAIEKVLLDATGVKPQASGEARQRFLVRVMMGVQKLPDEEWTALEAIDGAQDWYNAATDADNAEKDLPDFPDVEDAEEEQDDQEDDGAGDEPEEGEQVETKPKKAAKKAKSAKVVKAANEEKVNKAAAKPAKEKAAKAPKSEKGMSMRRALKMIVIKKPKLAVDDLIEQLEKKGYKTPSKLTVTSIRSDTRDTIRVLNDAGVTQIEL